MPESMLGEFIKSKREELGLTLRQLAITAELSPSQLSKIERGVSKKPNEETIQKIAYALNVDKSELLGLGGYLDEDIREDVLKNMGKILSPVAGGFILGGIVGAGIGAMIAGLANKEVAASTEATEEVSPIDRDTFSDGIKALISLRQPDFSEEDINAVANEMIAALSLYKFRKNRGDRNWKPDADWFEKRTVNIQKAFSVTLSDYLTRGDED